MVNIKMNSSVLSLINILHPPLIDRLLTTVAVIVSPGSGSTTMLRSARVALRHHLTRMESILIMAASTTARVSGSTTTRQMHRLMTKNMAIMMTRKTLTTTTLCSMNLTIGHMISRSLITRLTKSLKDSSNTERFLARRTIVKIILTEVIWPRSPRNLGLKGLTLQQKIQASPMKKASQQDKVKRAVRKVVNKNNLRNSQRLVVLLPLLNSIHKQSLTRLTRCLSTAITLSSNTSHSTSSNLTCTCPLTTSKASTPTNSCSSNSSQSSSKLLLLPKQCLL